MSAGRFLQWGLTLVFAAAGCVGEVSEIEAGGDDGFGSTTALFYNHAYSPSLALRWQSAATLSQESDGVEWSSSVGLYKSFGRQRLLSIEALVNGETGLDVGATEYGVRTRWQQPIYRDWLIADMTVGYFFPRKEAVTERGRAWALGASLLMRF